MTTMIERVARAIYEARNGRGCAPWGRLTKAHQAPYLSDARAAVGVLEEAIPEPMRACRAMIDAALKEG